MGSVATAKTAPAAAAAAHPRNERAEPSNRLSQISTNSKSSSHKRSRAHIGPWQLGRTLGRGSSGRVRLAKHSETGQLAAVKILPKALVDAKSAAVAAATASTADGTACVSGADNPPLPYGIEREVIIMKLIEHPNIMGLYDVWENKDELYLVLEYIEGGELFDYLISRGRLSEREAIHYFRQICYGVEYCHQFNICHRDLKPENLLLDKHRDIKIADFGMAALETQGRMLETSCGSPHYASPEIVAGRNYHGAPSDIWSCGIILFALLTGHLPFDDDNIRKLLLKVQCGKYVMPHYLSPEAKDLISRMLCVRPEDRITMRSIFAHPLLAKYPSRRIPAANTDMVRLVNASHPVGSPEDIDMEILRNLKTLWHRDSTEQIVQQLLSPSPNPEKTFYCLLVRYRDLHSARKPSNARHRAQNGASSSAPKRSSIIQANTPLAISLGSSSGPSPPRPVRAVPARQSPLHHRRNASQSSRRSATSLRTGAQARAASRSNSRYSIGSVGSRRKTGKSKGTKSKKSDNSSSTGSDRRRGTRTGSQSLGSEATSAVPSAKPPARAAAAPSGTTASSASAANSASTTASGPSSKFRTPTRTKQATTSLVPETFTDILEQAFANDELRAVSNPLPGPSQQPTVEPQRRVASMPTPEPIGVSGRFEQFHSAISGPLATQHEEFLPMIFEEDQFGDQVNDEFDDLHVGRRREPQQPYGGSQAPLIHLSFRPSEAAASVPAPTRPAPRAPSSRPNYSTRDPGNSTGIFNPYSVVPQVVLEPKRGTAAKGFASVPARRKPVPLQKLPSFQDDWLSEADQLNKISESDSPWETGFFALKSERTENRSPSPRKSCESNRLEQPRPAACARTGAVLDEPSNTENRPPVAHSKPALQPALVPKTQAAPSPAASPVYSSSEPVRQPLGERDPNQMTGMQKVDDTVKGGRSMLGRFSRRKTAAEPEKTKTSSRAMMISSSNYNVAEAKRKEASSSSSSSSSRWPVVAAPLMVEEPKQSWLLRVLALNSSSQTTSAKSLFSHLPEERLLAVITGIMDGWQRYGVSYASAGSLLTAHISPKNVLRLRQATFGVRVEPSFSTRAGSIAKFELQRGSKVAFQRYVNELERCLDNAGLLG